MIKKVTGIEIGEDSIKVVALAQSGRQITVSRFAEYPLNGEEPCQVLAKLVKEEIINNKVVYTGLPLDQVILRETSLPFSDRKRIDRTLMHSLSDSMPFLVNDAVYTYQLMVTADKQTKVISFLTHREKLETFRQIFSEGGLGVRAISVDSVSMAKVLGSLSGGESSYISLHLDLNRTSISIVEDKKVLYARKLNTKVNDILIALAKELSVSEGEAGKILFSGVDKEQSSYDLEKATKIVKTRLDQLIREVELSLKSFGLGPEKEYNIITSGEGAGVKGLLEYVQAGTGCRITSAELDDSLEIDNTINKDELTKKGMVALGYALMGIDGATINFIKGELPLFASPLFKSFYGQRKLLAVATAIVLILYTVSLLVDVNFQKKRYLGLKDQITSIFKLTLPDARVISGKEEALLNAALNTLDEKASVLSGGTNVKVVDILREITRAAPENVSFNITRMRIGKDGIRITGETANYDGVEKIKQNLKRVSLFSSVDVGGAKTSKLQNIVEFQLNIKMTR
ncbi:MAG: pilus assembly protein PilM [Proteobacteria bacterium]|nr:pilus assembly protein PilM [Pseudomonadota bacterium]